MQLFSLKRKLTLYRVSARTNCQNIITNFFFPFQKLLLSAVKLIVVVEKVLKTLKKYEM